MTGEPNLARLLRSARKWQTASRRAGHDESELDGLARRGVRASLPDCRRPFRRPRACDRSFARRKTLRASSAGLGRVARASARSRQQPQRSRPPSASGSLTGREQARLAIVDDFGDSAGSRRGDRASEGQRVEQHRAHALFARAETRDVGGGEQRIGVGSISGDMHRSSSTEPLHLGSTSARRWTVADEQRLQRRPTRLAYARSRARSSEDPYGRRAARPARRAERRPDAERRERVRRRGRRRRDACRRRRARLRIRSRVRRRSARALARRRVEMATITAARPYFHRVPALSRSRKSTRRDDDERHRRCRASRARAIATACAVCA